MCHELIIILMVGFMFRLIFVLGRTSDQDFHLYFLQTVAKNKLRHPDMDNSVEKGYLAYPPLPHFIVTLFPEKNWPIIGRVLNIVYDLLTVLVVYCVASFYLNSFFIVSNKAHLFYTLSPAGWVALIYATTPIMFPITARLKAMGGRTMGPLWVTVYFVIIGYAYVEEQSLLMFIALPFGVLTLLSSIFGTQVLVFFSICMSVILLNIWPLLIMFLVLMVGLILPGTDIKRLFISYIHFYKWYYKSLDLNSPIANRNKLKNYITLCHDLVRNPVKFVQTMFQDTSWFIALYSIPAMLVLVYVLVENAEIRQSMFSGGFNLYLFSIVFSGFAIFVLTSFKPLTIFGQAERYLEYAAPAIVLLFVSASLQDEAVGVFFVIFLINIALILLNFVVLMGEFFITQVTARADPLLEKCIDALQVVVEPRILTIPTKFANLLAYHMNNENAVFDFDWVVDIKDGYNYMIEDRSAYQYPLNDLDHYVNKYSINALVVKKRALDKAFELGINYNFDFGRLIYENPKYLVYIVK